MAEYEENAVDTEAGEPEEEILDEELAEETEPEGESLESIGEEDGTPEEEKTGKPESGPSEPGWIKQRVDKAVQRALAQERENIRSEYEQQFAPLRERLLEMDAQELVRKGVVKDLDTAKELVRYRNGQPQPERQEQPAQSRNEKGQFTKNENPREDPAIQKQVEMLSHQADVIKKRTGIDVIDAYNRDEDIKRKVISGEMDFYDVAEMLKQTPRKKPPAPMRSPNGASGQVSPNAIDSMSDEQFARLEKKIREGARYNLKERSVL